LEVDPSDLEPPLHRVCFDRSGALAHRQAALRTEERMKPPIQKGQPLWDKIITTSYLWLYAGCMILIGFDAGRFHWSAMAAGLQWLGAGGILISLWIRSQGAEFEALEDASRAAGLLSLGTQSAGAGLEDDAVGSLRPHHPIFPW